MAEEDDIPHPAGHAVSRAELAAQHANPVADNGGATS